MSEIRLRACPFCAFRRPILLTHKTASAQKSYSVKCDLKNGGCGAETRQFNYIEEAIDKWNMRAYENRRRRVQNRKGAE